MASGVGYEFYQKLNAGKAQNTIVNELSEQNKLLQQELAQAHVLRSVQLTGKTGQEPIDQDVVRGPDRCRRRSAIAVSVYATVTRHILASFGQGADMETVPEKLLADAQETTAQVRELF